MVYKNNLVALLSAGIFIMGVVSIAIPNILSAQSAQQPAPRVSSSTATSDDVLQEALTIELHRSFERLKNAEPVPLYYMDYEAYDIHAYDLMSTLGVIKNEWGGRHRYVDVAMRVGTPQHDNTHELRGMESYFDRMGSRLRAIPVEGDEAAIRASLWSMTEESFRAAQERFAKVQVNRAVEAEEEDRSGDFSAANKPETRRDSIEFPAFSKEEWKRRISKYSRLFKDKEYIQDSYVQLSVDSEKRFFVSSEGYDLRTGRNDIVLSYYLMTRTADGMDLWRYKNYEGARFEDLPADEEIIKDIATSITELNALRHAPLAEPFSGPVILKNKATGVFFHETVGHRVEGERQKSEQEGQTFKKKLNKKITSPLISIYDDPTLERYHDEFLTGHYVFDDQGVRAERVPIVERGVLKNFLMDRVPIFGFLKSNGHGRREQGHSVEARQGNLIIEASETVSYEELRQELIKEIRKQKKPYGLVFEDIEGGETATGRDQAQSFHVFPMLVYRIYPDGRPDEVVRGVNIVGTPLTALEKIKAAADDDEVENGRCGAASGSVPVSMIAPSVLITELEVEKAPKSEEKPPILKPPLFDSESAQ